MFPPTLKFLKFPADFLQITNIQKDAIFKVAVWYWFPPRGNLAPRHRGREVDVPKVPAPDSRKAAVAGVLLPDAPVGTVIFIKKIGNMAALESSILKRAVKVTWFIRGEKKSTPVRPHFQTPFFLLSILFLTMQPTLRHLALVYRDLLTGIKVRLPNDFWQVLWT